MEKDAVRKSVEVEKPSTSKSKKAKVTCLYVDFV